MVAYGIIIMVMSGGIWHHYYGNVYVVYMVVYSTIIMVMSMWYIYGGI